MRFVRRFGKMIPLVAAFAVTVTAAGDDRELVKLPEPMQAHMLANMRDHLVTLNELLKLVAREDYKPAAELAEARLGMSSLGLHGASHMAPFMPQPMQEMGTSMHHAASRFALVATDADVERSKAALQQATAALQEITASCTACHAAYRLR
ncbi:MAG: cytochrome c [Proteobacteria bacterium]|nr:cytochrome c [Pseudomonadota bacterium]